MNNKIQNPKTEVPETTALNDCDYLNEVLACEKNMSVNMTIALNEASNDTLYNELFPIFKEIKECHRELFNLAFKKGWYSLEKAETLKVSQKISELNQKISQLIN